MEAKKILIVEDSEIQAVILKRILEKEGYEVSVARDGAEGLAIAQKVRPDLIISDIMMPVMDGYEMCKRLRDDDSLKGTPLILLTQLIELEDVVKGLEFGADHYLTKPVNEEYLLNKVALLLKNPDAYRNDPVQRCIVFEYDGRRYKIHASRTQTVSYLISTYENALLNNKRLMKAEEELRVLNETLEHKVKERTADLEIEIAERKKAEDAAVRAEAKFHTLFDSFPDAIFVINMDNHFLQVNHTACERLGYSQEELLRMSPADIDIPDYAAKVPERIKALMEQGKLVFETAHVSRDGKVTPIELSDRIIDYDGKPAIIGIARDISERKAAEEKLKSNYEDIKRMNKMMVDREIRMTELKKEIERLKARVEEMAKKA